MGTALLILLLSGCLRVSEQALAEACAMSELPMPSEMAGLKDSASTVSLLAQSA